MKDIWKKQYKNILLVIGYTIVACTVYGVWVNSAWNLWYIDLIVIVLIAIIGAFLGYFFVKSELKQEQDKEAKGKTEAPVNQENEQTTSDLANNLEKK